MVQKWVKQVQKCADAIGLGENILYKRYFLIGPDGEHMAEFYYEKGLDMVLAILEREVDELERETQE